MLKNVEKKEKKNKSSKRSRKNSGKIEERKQT